MAGAAVPGWLLIPGCALGLPGCVLGLQQPAAAAESLLLDPSDIYIYISYQSAIATWPSATETYDATSGSNVCL